MSVTKLPPSGNLKPKLSKLHRPITTLNRFKRAKPKLITLYYNWPLFKSPYSFFTEYKLHSQEEQKAFLAFYEEVRETVDFAYCEAKAKEFNISYFLSERKKLKESLLEPIEDYKEALFILNLCVEFSVVHRDLLKRGKL